MFSLNFNHSARDMSVFTNSDIQLHVRCPLTGEFDDKANIFSVKIRMCSPLNVKNISRQRNRSSAVSCDPILHWITVTVLLITIIVHIFFWRMSWLFFECFFFCEIVFWFHFLFLLLSSKLSCSEADNNIRSGKCQWQDNSHHKRTDRHTLKAGSR